MRIRYNAPVILTLTLISTAVLILENFPGLDLTRKFFMVYPTFHSGSPLDYLRLFTHILGHKNWSHLIANFSFILLIGPILEEKYRSNIMLIMILITALITGVLNILFFSTGLMAREESVNRKEKNV